MGEEDPFDTSAIIIPTGGVRADDSSHLPTSSSAAAKTSDYEERSSTKLPHVLSQLEPFMSPKEKTPENIDDFSAFTNHRRAISNLQDADSMLPQLTSPLSPPAFNPHEILLGSNEAIAGLDSPAPVPT